MVGRELSFVPDPRRAAADAPVVLEVAVSSRRPVISASFIAALRRDRLPRRACGRRAHRDLRGHLRRAADPVRHACWSMAARSAAQPVRRDGRGHRHGPGGPQGGRPLPRLHHRREPGGREPRRLHPRGPLSRTPRCARSAEEYVRASDRHADVEREVRPLAAATSRRSCSPSGSRASRACSSWMSPRAAWTSAPRRTSTASCASSRQRHGAAGRVLGPARGPRAGAPHRGHVGGSGRRRDRRSGRRPRSPSSSSPRPGIACQQVPHELDDPPTRSAALGQRRAAAAVARPPSVASASPPTGRCCWSCSSSPSCGHERSSSRPRSRASPTRPSAARHGPDRHPRVRHDAPADRRRLRPVDRRHPRVLGDHRGLRSRTGDCRRCRVPRWAAAGACCSASSTA